jgi:hypothetical protein
MHPPLAITLIRPPDMLILALAAAALAAAAPLQDPRPRADLERRG